MCGRSCVRGDRGGRLVLALLTALTLTSGCMTTQTCELPPSEARRIEIVRSSGGVVLRSSHVVLTTTGTLFYREDAQRCVQINPDDSAKVIGSLTAPPLIEYLGRIEAKGYDKKYHDAPHLLVRIDGMSVFVPLVLTLSDPLQGPIELLDRLLRRSFGSEYRYPLLPADVERDDLRQLMPTVTNELR